jgi:hypothetical protein
VGILYYPLLHVTLLRAAVLPNNSLNLIQLHELIRFISTSTTEAATTKGAFRTTAVAASAVAVLVKLNRF